MASDIVKSYERCRQGDFQHLVVLEEMYEKLRRRPRSDTVMKPHPQDEVDEDDEDDDDEEPDEEEQGEAMDLEPSRDANRNEGPVIDDDGFQLVQGKGKRRGR